MTALIPDLFSFVALTLVLGGAAAFVSGRALARTWRPPVLLAPVALALEGAVRFLHYALAGEGTDPVQALLGAIILGGFAGAGFAWRRRAQMAQQYGWLRQGRSSLQSGPDLHYRGRSPGENRQ